MHRQSKSRYRRGSVSFAYLQISFRRYIRYGSKCLLVFSCTQYRKIRQIKVLLENFNLSDGKFCLKTCFSLAYNIGRF